MSQATYTLNVKWKHCIANHVSICSYDKKVFVTRGKNIQEIEFNTKIILNGHMVSKLKLTSILVGGEISTNRKYFERMQNLVQEANKTEDFGVLRTRSPST